MTPTDLDHNPALFGDVESVALGVRDAGIPRFDLRPVLERLSSKGSIVVTKSHCDGYRRTGHRALASAFDDGGTARATQ